MHALSNFEQTIRTVIAGVHGGHVGEQSLGSTDVAGGFFAANMLLASLKRKAQCRSSARIFGDADNSAGHVAFESVARGEEGSVRPTIAERDAETLGAADSDVGAEFTGWLEQCKGEKVGGDG